MLSAASPEPSHARVQVHVYLPGKNHPAHDTVRAIVKDDTDTFTGDSSRVWVDSGAPLLMYILMNVKGPAAMLCGLLSVEARQDAP